MLLHEGARTSACMRVQAGVNNMWMPHNLTHHFVHDEIHEDIRVAGPGHSSMRQHAITTHGPNGREALPTHKDALAAGALAFQNPRIALIGCA